MPRRRPDRSQQQKRSIPKRAAARVIKLSRRRPDRVQRLLDQLHAEIRREQTTER